MQTFLPYSSFEQSAQVLDWRRLGKQRVEGMQIINAINNPTQKGWVNHPATVMWRPYVEALKLYTNTIIEEWIQRGYNNNMKLYKIENLTMPHWLGNEKFHSSHRANLLRKDYEYYSQFGWKENPESPYIWLDADNTRWYEHYSNTGMRVYL
tara:strand:+ start:13 stop:468 length:456 start_codon:yes stop_codon:yes gene_type:complete